MEGMEGWIRSVMCCFDLIHGPLTHTIPIATTWLAMTCAHV